MSTTEDETVYNNGCTFTGMANHIRIALEIQRPLWPLDKDLAEAAGVSNKVLSATMARKTGTSAAFLQIAQAMGIKPDDLRGTEGRAREAAREALARRTAQPDISPGREPMTRAESLAAVRALLPLQDDDVLLGLIETLQANANARMGGVQAAPKKRG